MVKIFSITSLDLCAYDGGFDFAKGLTGIQQHQYGLKDIVDYLKSYHFEVIETREDNFRLVVIVPFMYSRIRMQWMYEIFKFYLTAGVEIEVREAKPDER